MTNTRISGFAVGRLRKSLLLNPKHDAAFTLDLIKIHGRLYYGYEKCIGKKTLKAAYWPQEKGWYTFALWVVTIILLASPYFDGPWVIFIQFAIVLGLYFPLSIYCIRQGLPDDLLAVGITGEFTMQPWKIHGPIIRLMWFHSYVTEREKISYDEIKKCLEFVDFISKDESSWTSYFRHPLIILLVGIVVYAFNAQIGKYLNSATPEAEKFFSKALTVVIQLLGLGLMLYSWRHSGPERRWSFLRCLRWIELSMRP